MSGLRLSRRQRVWTLLGGIALTVFAAADVMAVFLDLFDRFPGMQFALVIANVLVLVAIASVLWQAASTEAGLVLGMTRKEAEARTAALLKEVDVRKCLEIDIMGLALRRELFKRDSDFSKWLLECLRTNRRVRVRIMLLDPDRTQLLALRERAERDRGTPDFLAASVKDSLATLRDLTTSVWKEQKLRRPEIVLVTEVVIQQWLLRIDDQMLVAPYLQHKTGASSPVFALKKDASPWFDVFQEQFDKCFAMHQDNVFPRRDELEREVAQL